MQSNQLLKVKDRLLQLEKKFYGIEDRELKDRKEKN